MLNRFFLFFFILCSVFTLKSQTDINTITGSVSFISTQNIYVKFVSTNGISIGDTLYIEQNEKLIPAMIIDNISSISCVGKPFEAIKLTLTNTLIAKKKIEIPLEVVTEKSVEAVAINDQSIEDAKKSNVKTLKNKKQEVYGRLSLSSYSNYSTDNLSQNSPNFRFKYNLALNVANLAGTKLSYENYISYTHTINYPKQQFNDLRIYNLAFNYAIDSTSNIILGRKINPNTANIGAVDGLQVEKSYKAFKVGALAGFRPNDSTYGFDLKLLQYGAFISHHSEKKHATTQTSLAFFNQTNQFKTDRRYIYLQHSNTLLRNLDLFGSAEVDLFAIEKNVAITDFDLTSLYLSLDYRPIRKLSLSLTYDARKNVYYYETYKNRIDSLLENETRQGFRFRFNYNPIKHLYWGGNTGYRLNSPTSSVSMNAISYLTYSSIPLIDASCTITGTVLKTANMTGFIYGVNLSKDFLDSKLFAEIEYRKAPIFAQDIAELSLSWHITKNLMLSSNFEATFEQGFVSGRAFMNISKRF